MRDHQRHLSALKGQTDSSGPVKALEEGNHDAVEFDRLVHEKTRREMPGYYEADAVRRFETILDVID